MKVRLIAFFCMVALSIGGFTYYFLNLPKEPEIRTTSPEIAISNLDAQISSLQEAVEQYPERAEPREKLVDLLLNRIQFLATYEDFATLLTLAGEAVRLHPDAPGSYALQARVFQALHRFEEASQAVQRAVERGLPEERAREIRADISMATGADFKNAAEFRAQRLKAARNFATLTDMAAVFAALGQYYEADALYREALEVYRDASPFPVAWVYFQRGVMWAEQANEPEPAYDLYKRAVTYLPQYVRANIHLAELEWERGERDRATHRLEKMVDEDPEAAAVLADLLGDTEQANDLVDRARAGYEALLNEHEAAFRDHAAEFFLGAGSDPERAWRLARTDFETRKTDRAYELAIRAAEAAGDPQARCTLVKEAAQKFPKSQALTRVIEQKIKTCG